MDECENTKEVLINSPHHRYKSKLASGLVLAVCLLLPFLALYWMVPFIGKYAIGNDYTKYWIENQMFLRFSLSYGTFPLYAPGFNGGWTASALTLGQLCHPISWLSAVTPGYWNGFAIQINTLFRLVELGVTCAILFLFLRKLRLSIPLAFVLSFITIFNLRMLDMFRYSASLENYTAMLLLCAALGWFYLSPKNYLLPLFISICTWLLVVGGHPQMMYIGLLGSAAVFILFPFYASRLLPDEHPPGFRRVFSFWGWSALSVMLGILLASIYTLPFYFEYMKESYRGTSPPFQGACWLQETFGGILCNFFNPFFSDVHSAFGVSSLVLLAMLLPVAGVFCLRRAWPAMVFWLCCVVVLISAVGSNGPLYYYFWRYFPFAGTFRGPGRLCMTLPFMFMLILAWMFQQKTVRLRLLGREIIMSPLVPAAVVALAVFIVPKSFNYSELTGADRFVPANINVVPPIVLSVFFVSGIICLASIIIYGISNKLRTVSAVILVASVLTATFVVLRYGTWIVPGYRTTETFAQMKDELTQRLYYRDATGDRYRITTGEHLKRTFLEPSMARICRRYDTVDSQQQAYQRLDKLREIDLAYIEGFQGDKSEPSYSDPNIDSVKLKYSSYNNCIFDVVCSQPAFFVFSYPYSPRWQAKIDGKAAPVYRCDAMEHAVRISPGSHSIEFRYYSRATIAGAVISCLSLAVIIIWLLFRIPRMAQIRWPAAIVTAILCALLLTAVFYSFYNGGNIGTRYFWTSVQITPNLSSRCNLAYGRKTWMNISEGASNSSSSLGVDGDRQGSFGFFTSDKNSAWWFVDLGAEHNIGEIVIYKTKGGLSSLAVPFEVLLSPEWNTFTFIQIVAGEELFTDSWRISVPDRKARFIGLRTLGPGLLHFSEVEVYK